MANEPAVSYASAVSHEQALDRVWVMLQTLSLEDKRQVAKQLMDELVAQPKGTYHVVSVGHQLSDEELAKKLENLPSFDEVEHPDLSNVDYGEIQRALSGRLPKGTGKVHKRGISEAGNNDMKPTPFVLSIGREVDLSDIPDEKEAYRKHLEEKYA